MSDRTFVSHMVWCHSKSCEGQCNQGHGANLEAELEDAKDELAQLREHLAVAVGSLESYAGEGKYSEWETLCRYLTFDKFGCLCEETAGPWEAIQALATIRGGKVGT